MNAFEMHAFDARIAARAFAPYRAEMVGSQQRLCEIHRSHSTAHAIASVHRNSATTVLNRSVDSTLYLTGPKTPE